MDLGLVMGLVMVSGTGAVSEAGAGVRMVLVKGLGLVMGLVPVVGLVLVGEQNPC